MKPTLVDGFLAVVPPGTPPTEIEGPLGVALKGGGRLPVGPYLVGIPGIPEALLEPRDGRYRGSPVTVYRLPEYLARVCAAWQANGQKYNWLLFARQYKQDLAEELARELRESVLSVRMPGLHGHADTDPRLGLGEVGLNPRDMKRLGKKLGVALKDGATLWCMRYPPTGPKAVHPVTLFVLPDRLAGHVYVNETCLREWMEGDSDGDLLYLFAPAEVWFASVKSKGRFPKVDLGEARPLTQELAQAWVEPTQSDILDRVIGARIKDVTGSMTYTLNLITRNWAEHLALGEVGEERKAAFQAAYLRGTVVHGPLMEGIMDAWKRTSEIPFHCIGDMADMVVSFASGGDVSGPAIKSVFAPFLDEETRELLSPMTRGLGGQPTTVGRALLAAGSKPEAVGRVLLQAIRTGDDPGKWLDRVADDLYGQAAMDFQPEARKKSGPRVSDGLGMTGNIAQAVTYKGSVCLECSITQENERAWPVFSARLLTLWDEEPGEYTVAFPWPVATPIGVTGHMVVQKPGGGMRLFRPILVDGLHPPIDYGRWIQEALLQGVRDVMVRGLRHPNSVQKAMRKAVDRQVNSLTEYREQSGCIHVSQFAVKLPDTGRLSLDWDVARSILREIDGLTNPDGTKKFGIAYTRKGSHGAKQGPGSIVTLLGKRGIPSYVGMVDPFAQYGEQSPKRLAEYAGIAEAPPLLFPQEPKVKALGTKVPDPIRGCFTVLRVMVADLPGINTWAGKCHDTLVTCPSADWKLQLAEFSESFRDRGEAEAFQEQVEETGGVAHLETRIISSNDGLRLTEYRVRVEKGWTDPGKVKSVPPIKGVQTRIPVQLDGDQGEIDVVIPWSTVQKKQALNVLLLGLAGKAGIEKIDPQQSLQELVSQIREALFEQGQDPDGMEVIRVGRDILGRAVVLELPFYRGTQTSASSFKCSGVPVDLNTLLAHDLVPEEIAKKTRRRVAQIVASIQDSGKILGGARKEKESETRRR